MVILSTKLQHGMVNINHLVSSSRKQVEVISYENEYTNIVRVSFVFKQHA